MKPNHITYHTEDNRLQGVQDNNIGAYYGYDSQGERGLKLTGPTIQVNINGYTYQVSALKEQTLYASPLITINDKGYTKHYFEEGKRICSKIGSGELRDINDLVGHMEMNYEDQLNTQYDGIRGGLNCLQNAWFDLENNSLYDHIIQTYENPINPEEPIFYYHSDHLGSASFLTDRDGIETQQLVYLPFGEDWVDLKYNTQQYDTPYKFNGKEKDEETGYNNYGARYYYDWATIWLSVDPMSDKYPNESNYIYCSNNPILFIDPDGNEKLIWTNRNTENALAKAQDKYKDDGAIHVFTHGFPQGLLGPNFIKTRTGVRQEPITDPKVFVERLKNSEVWKNRKDGEQITIVLHACRTGRETYDESGNRHASFAEELSKLEEMKDVYIIAPTERDYFDDNGEVGTYKAKLADRNGEYLHDKNGQDKNTERSSKTGEWITYKNGKKVDSHKGNWKPKEVE